MPGLGPVLEELLVGHEQEEEVMEETGDWVEFSMACTMAGSVLENSDSSWVGANNFKKYTKD